MQNQNTKDDVVIEFTSNLRKKLGPQLISTILFGSRARGDFKHASDYDFLVIVKKKNSHQKKMLYDICISILDKYDALVSFLLFDNNEWQRKKRHPLGLNIIKEGIPI